MTFAHVAEKVGDGESGHSRVLADDRDKLGVERLDPMVTNWRCRPMTAGRPCAEQSLAEVLDAARVHA